MNEANQGNDPDAPPSIPVKRKRGRPRKDRSLNHSEPARVPPGFEAVNGNQTRQVDAVDEPNDDMVGQAVTGVVETAFDAGYLLTVRIGNSDTCLRGVVFKPGHYVPISAQNDVAPHVQMIRRNNIRHPTENTTRVRGHSQRSRERNEQYINFHGNETSLVLNGSSRTNRAQRIRKGKQVSLVAAPSVPLVGSRGTLVPVVLQPVTLSNGLQQATHVGPSKDKQAQIVAGEPVHGQPQPNQISPKSGQNENGAFHQGTPEVLRGEEAKPMKICSQSLEAHNENSAAASKLSTEDSDHHANLNEPLVIEPLQAIGSDGNQSITASKVLENNRTGRMTELLQALQETMAENKEHRVEKTGTNT